MTNTSLTALDINASPNWDNVEALVVQRAVQAISDGTFRLETNAGNLLLEFNQYGLRLRSEQQVKHDYGMLKKRPSALPACIKQDSEHCLISTDEQSVRIDFHPMTFEYRVKGKKVQGTPNDGHFVRQYRLPPFAKLAQGWLLSFDLKACESVYGLGEKWGRLNKRGQLVRSYNHDALGVNAEISYKNTPFAWSPEGWGVFVHTPAPVTHAVGYAQWSQRAYAALVEDECFDLFVLNGDSGADIIQRYTDLTGKAPVPPLWSLGVILSKAYYKDIEETLTTAKAVRSHQMPCDVITLDGRAWQDTDTRFAFEWDPNRYRAGEPEKLISQLKAQNFKVCIWEYPLISVKHSLFDRLAKKGWMLKDKRTGEAYRYKWDMSAFGEVLTPLPESGILDFTHPEAFVFWLESHKPLFDLGVDMIKADFGEQVEDDNMLAHSGDSGKRLHNVYSMLYNQCVYQAAQKYCQSGPFLFSRSAWIGSQCYPSQWGGDPQADWGGLAASIRGALSWGMSGAPYFATDVGGFYKDTRDAELFVRWTQVAVFSAHMRLHGIGQRETWSYGEQARLAADKALALRYQLIPYIQNAMQQASDSGLPLMRGMALAFANERPAWAYEEQFMFGDDILVVPCLEVGGEVEFYLPQGQWIKLSSKDNWQGGKHYRQTLALDDLAVFVRAGAKLPIGPKVQHTDALNGQAVIVGYWPDINL